MDQKIFRVICKDEKYAVGIHHASAHNSSIGLICVIKKSLDTNYNVI